ncbi:MAG TPA: hypothetical protein VH251_01600 [Verrucomicrobiae bacterium]|nr:hypothetical protein [Verrucomicrobiae bacterium]
MAVAVSGFAINTFACGPDFPNNLLDDGDHAVLQPPVADFQRELERMKIKPTRLRAVPLPDGQSYSGQSTEAEMADLAAALQRTKVSSELAKVILQAHLAERMKLNAYLQQRSGWEHYSPGSYVDTNGNYVSLPNTNPPPVFPNIAVTPGLPREFADYFEGAIEWQKDGNWTASEDWQRVLALPEAERHFKSTWAAFMLGEYNGQSANYSGNDEAIKYFEQVRTLAKKGFADTTGLAVFSLGEEARIWLDRKNYERALELYLEQMAAGGGSALDSLRFAAARAVVETNSTPAQLKALALNPRTRRVITAYLISRRPYSDRSESTNDPDAQSFFDRTDNWLAAVDAAGVRDVESAEQLALAAYQADDMDAAQHWIDHAKSSPVVQWLQAKLYLRAGKTSEAAKLLAKVSREFPQEFPATNASANFAQSLFVNIDPEREESIPIGRQSLGELGVLHLARREYAEALDALIRSGYWMDAAYVAERVLTTEELKRYVDRNWPPIPPAAQAEEARDSRGGDRDWGISNPREEIRYLLARRMARETGSLVAANYYPTNLTDVYKTFRDELKTGRDEALMNEIRAKNLYSAAILERTNGMELFGTEMEPDWEINGGNFEFGFTWAIRATNSLSATVNEMSDDEIARASSRQVDPDRRFHYRWQAAALAWEAAQLMPNNTDETARVLCTAGTWLKDRDPEGADQFYKALVRRCRKTPLGQQADVLRWFPAQDIDGELPRLETMDITAETTNAVASDSNGAGTYTTEFPVPGRKYAVQEDEDVYIIARAVQRLDCAMSVQDILQANPRLRRGPLPVGIVITIPEAPAGAENSAR